MTRPCRDGRDGRDGMDGREGRQGAQGEKVVCSSLVHQSGHEPVWQETLSPRMANCVQTSSDSAL